MISSTVRIQKKDFFNMHIKPRVHNVSKIPTSFAKEIVNIILGIGTLPLAICTFGRHKPIVEYAFENLSGLNRVLTRPYRHLILAMNPDTYINIGGNSSAHVARCSFGLRDKWISNEGKILVFGPVLDRLNQLAETNRCLISQLSCLSIAVVALVSRVAEAIIGIPAAGLAILTLGRMERVNWFGARALETPGLIWDLFYCAIKCMNPVLKLPDL